MIGHSRTRGHSRGDSIGQYFRENFRGHSRQASRTESIYTIRQTATNNKRRIKFWQKTDDSPPVEREHRKVVPNHLVPSDTKVNNFQTTAINLSETKRDFWDLIC